MKERKNLSMMLWLGAGILLVGFLFTRILLADKPWISYGLLVPFAGALVMLIRENRKALTGRTAAYGVNSLITVLLVVGLVGVLNFLASRYPLKWDITEKKLHTLSDQTSKIVKGLTRDVHATLYANAQGAEKNRPFLSNLKDLTPKFHLEIVNPDKEPTRAKQAGVKKYDTLVLTIGDKTKKVEEIDEEKVTNALINLLKEKNQVLCAIAGHGEKDFKAMAADGYETVRKELEEQAYEVKDVNLPQEAKVPAECNAIAIIGPTKSFYDPEIKALQEYLDGGGRALVAVDIDVTGSKLSPELLPLLERWYVRVRPALIVDPLSRMLGVDAAVPIIPTYSPDHKITQDFRVASHFPFAQPLEIMDGAPAGLNATWLSKSSPKSWGETDLGELKRGQVSFTKSSDLAGPVVTAAAVEGKQKDSKAPRDTRLVVFGTSHFASNNYSRFGGNLDLFMNAASWVMEDENLISIRAKEDDAGKIELTSEAGAIIFWLTFAIVPIFTAVSGIVIWVRRRRL